MSVNYGQEKKTQRQRVLEALSDLGWHSFKALVRVGGIRYSARILELKRLGYVIEDRETGDGSLGKEYRLTSLVPGAPQEKRVKVFLDAQDVSAMLNTGTVPLSARAPLAEALGSFCANMDKL